MIQLLLIDDHPVVREGLSVVLQTQADFTVVAACSSADEALTIGADPPPEVILLDLEMPGLAGGNAIEPLLARWPSAHVLVFTAYDSDERVLNALRAGASGYLLKGAPSEKIAAAVRAVARGKVHLEPRVASRVLGHVAAPAWISGALTPRESEVLRLVAGGNPNKQIAHLLGISESTVKYHLVVIYRKLGAENRARAVALAGEKGLL